MRRYCRANRMRFLWTLTYREAPSSRKQVTKDLRWFFRQMGRLFRKQALIAVIETGTATNRLHVHFAASRFLSIEKVRRAWGRGIVHVGDPGQLAGRVPVRRLAAYLAKYVSKQSDDVATEGAKERAQGEHRYLVTQGFTPAAWSLRYVRVGQAHERMLGLYGQPDAECPFGDWHEGPIFGIWYSFPDRFLHPPPGTLPPGG